MSYLGERESKCVGEEEGAIFDLRSLILFGEAAEMS